jgi:hypothetical protein
VLQLRMFVNILNIAEFKAFGWSRSVHWNGHLIKRSSTVKILPINSPFLSWSIFQ